MIDQRLERLATGDSWLHRRAAGAKLATFTLMAVAVLTEQTFSPWRMAAYTVCVAVIVWCAGLPLGPIVRRCGIVLPVLLLAGALPWLSRMAGDQNVRIEPALVLGKGLLAVALFTLLAASTRFAEIVGALERMRAPSVVRALVGLMYRYVPLLGEEWRRMEVARASRTPGRVARRDLSLLGRQLANLFLRAWQRAERVQAAMESRAFTGRWRHGTAEHWSAGDWAFVLGALGWMVTVRVSAWWWHHAG